METFHKSTNVNRIPIQILHFVHLLKLPILNIDNLVICHAIEKLYFSYPNDPILELKQIYAEHNHKNIKCGVFMWVCLDVLCQLKI